VAVYRFKQLIQPGSREEAKVIFDEIQHSHRSEYEASRRHRHREGVVWLMERFVDHDIVLCVFPERSGGYNSGSC
jgi:hypothetical protein